MLIRNTYILSEAAQYDYEITMHRKQIAEAREEQRRYLTRSNALVGESIKVLNEVIACMDAEQARIHLGNAEDLTKQATGYRVDALTSDEIIREHQLKIAKLTGTYLPPVD